MLKKTTIILIMILLLFGLSMNALAADKYTTTSTLNGVTANWEYELSDSGEIENLVCTNAESMSGSITIPSTLDGKTVSSLGNNAFKSAKSITSVKIPDTIKEIGMWAFSGCTDLENVDLGSVEKLNDKSFYNCMSLESIKIPKTLSKDASGAPFYGCSILENIELEEGMTVIPNYLCADTDIREIKIPSTVKEIGLWAFSGCVRLTKVDLGNVEKINDKAFEDCASLPSIKLPKTLSKDASGAPFINCTALANIELEEGMTRVPNFVCARTPIEEITIPSTVKEIGLWAFSGCKDLAKVDFGDVERICDKSFEDCISLTSIKLPKTLSKDASGAPFSGCTDLKNIELEEGMTRVPMYVCASTPIEEITIPSTASEIDLWAFSNCTALKKITILDNVTKMSGYTTGGTDYIFQNHNDDLTIYCYKDSVAAGYATKFNIKYVYLDKPTSSTPTTNTNSNTKNTNNTNTNTKNTNVQNTNTNSKSNVTNTNTKNTNTSTQKDNTIANGVLPKTGATAKCILFVVTLSIVGTISYVKYKNLNKYL